MGSQQQPLPTKEEKYFCEYLPQSCGTISCEAEVRILVDGTRNQAGDLVADAFIFTKDVRERGCERGCALNASEMNLANV